MTLADNYEVENINVRCIFCRALYSFAVEKEDLERYERGEDLVQNIFPYLSADERELLISQVCPKCFPK